MLNNVFSHYYVIQPPKNVILLDKPTVALHGSGITFYRGLTPKWRSDVVVITPQGDDETAIHEAIHAQFHAGELAANLGGKIMIWKSRLLHRQIRNVQYQRCYDCQLEKNLYQDLGIFSPPNSHPVHYVLVSN